MPQFIRIFLYKFKEYIALILLLILSLIFITLNNNKDVKNVKLFALGIFAGLNSSISNLGVLFENTDYIENLEKTNAELMLEVNLLRNYGLENNELKEMLEFQKSSKYNLISAKIVSRLVSKISGYYIISEGISHGVESGMPVITDKGLVGITVDVAESYATVRTFENSLFKVAVKNQRSNIDGILNWDGKNLFIKNVPTTHDFEVGDRIVVSELSTILPPAIPIGIISEKESTVSGILSNLKVRPFANLNSIRNVLVLQVSINRQVDSLEQNLMGGEK